MMWRKRKEKYKFKNSGKDIIKKIKFKSIIIAIIILISSIGLLVGAKGLNLEKVSNLANKINPQKSISTFFSETVPKTLNITTGKNIIGTVEYSNFYLEVQKITSDAGIGYCLEVEKDYPSGQKFEFEGKPAEDIIGILAAGYPNKSAAELGLSSDNDAYVATQLALWSVTEGYNANRYESSNKALVGAIKNIYNEGKNYNETNLNFNVMEYYVSDNIQRIVVCIVNSNEDETEPSVPDTNNPDTNIPDTDNPDTSIPDEDTSVPEGPEEIIPSPELG